MKNIKSSMTINPKNRLGESLGAVWVVTTDSRPASKGFNVVLDAVINRMKRFVFSLGLFMFLVSCNKANSADDAVTGFSLLDGNDFVLAVDRMLETSSVQLLTDDLQENDYRETNEGAQYHVTLSEDGQIVTIEPGSMRGQRINDGDESKLYELTEGLFAGGRFVVWVQNDGFQAELTIYGSGIPIVKSERGNLRPGQ
jgi:hypothetical protein